MTEQIWMIAVRDEQTGIVLQGSVMADSEIEAREKITSTLDRLFAGATQVAYGPMPEPLSGLIEMMHQSMLNMDPAQMAPYHIGGGE